MKRYSVTAKKTTVVILTPKDEPMNTDLYNALLASRLDMLNFAYGSAADPAAQATQVNQTLALHDTLLNAVATGTLSPEQEAALLAALTNA